ncbi:MAG: ABC transporter substrate-binding protein [SAR324 cluster bacterium]|nr:ABC transporter substrate-binding protein [SAR324 cluster bacterium]
MNLGLKKKFKKIALFAGIAFAVSQLGPVVNSVQAATPKNTLVIAKNISDIITLDPAEVFEFTAGELIANIYDRVMMFEPENLTKLVGGVAESYSISADGKTVTLKIRPGQKFHSGNPVSAEDVVYSLQRVIHLNKTPVFIFTQFGWSKENVSEVIKLVDSSTVELTIKSDLSAAILLNSLQAGIGSVVDKKLVMSHEKDGDMGYDWLKNHSAGSGAFSLKVWKANELVTLEANPDYRHGAPKLKRLVMQHVAEASAQRLLLEKGDIDIARNLPPDQAAGLKGNSDIAVDFFPKATLVYLAANREDKFVGHPKVQEALRYLVDYEGMTSSFLKGQYKIHQAFWPSGLWGSLEDTPFSLNVAKAKALLAEAGYADGFKVSIDTLTRDPFGQIAQSIQQTLGQAGIEAEIILSEGKTLWPKYRARKHQLIVAIWGPDYVDPHSNADSFAHNPDNRFESKLTGKLAWRNAWSDAAVNKMTEQASAEVDVSKRTEIYLALQKSLQQDSPFSVLFQENELTARRANVKGLVSGANFDLVFYRNTSK